MVLELKARTRAFLAALHRRDLTTCGDLLLQLAALTAVHPVTQVWHDYCAAVLYHEQEANVAVAERRYRELLQTTDLDPFLAGQVQISLATAAMQTGAYGPAATAAQAAVNVFQVDEIRAAILDAARPGPGVAPGAWHARYGVGRIDATATLLSILSPTPQPVTVTASAASGERPLIPVIDQPGVDNLFELLVAAAYRSRTRLRFQVEIEPLEVA